MTVSKNDYRLQGLILLALTLLLSNISAWAGALQCDGTDDLVTVLDANNDFDPGTSVTVEAWMKLDSYTDFGSAVSGYLGALTLGQSAFSGSMKPSISVSIPTTNAALGSTIIPLSTWVHIAGSYDGVNLRVYLNGVLEGTTNHPGTTANVSELRFCRFSTATGPFMDGAIDEVRWWNTVRSASEIATNRFRVLSGSEAGLVGYWRFEEAVGQDVLDSSAAGNNGVLGSNNTADNDDPSRILLGAPGPTAPVPILNWQGIGLMAALLAGFAYYRRRKIVIS